MDVTYVLVINNALYIPLMKNNTMPPFIMREAGTEIIYTLKI